MLMVGSGEAAINTLVTIPVTIADASAIDAFGFRLHFDGTRLDFVSISAAETIAAEWYSVDGKASQAGQVIIGGYRGTGDPLSGSGALVNVTLRVRPTAAGVVPLMLNELVDDIAGAATAPGEIVVTGVTTSVGNWQLFE
jgi:hypothetical protein